MLDTTGAAPVLLALVTATTTTSLAFAVVRPGAMIDEPEE
jgi:hypothetical protein